MALNDALNEMYDDLNRTYLEHHWVLADEERVRVPTKRPLADYTEQDISQLYKKYRALTELGAAVTILCFHFNSGAQEASRPLGVTSDLFKRIFDEKRLAESEIAHIAYSLYEAQE